MVMVEPAVRAALLEDLGRAGDLTTDAIVSAEASARTALVARQPGVVAGLDFAASAFRLIDPAIRMTVALPDGSRLRPGDTDRYYNRTRPRHPHGGTDRLELPLPSQRRRLGDSAGSWTRSPEPEPKVCCTRKTIPGLRFAQKFAVRVGGGSNHRFGLDDAVLIKDNHVAVAGGVRPAVERARAGVGHLVKIELEVDTLAQLQEALTLKVDAVLLDNMGPDLLRQAVAMVDGRAITEASGRIRPDTAHAHRCKRRRSAVGRLADALRHRAGYRLELVGPRLVLLSRKTPRPFRNSFCRDARANFDWCPCSARGFLRMAGMPLNYSVDLCPRGDGH